MADEEKFLKPVHPGEVLFHDFMQPLDISQNALAKAIGVPPRRINQIKPLLWYFGNRLDGLAIRIRT